MIPYGLTLEKHVFGFQSHVVEKNFLSLEKPVYQTDLLGVRGLSSHCTGRFILLTLIKLLHQIKFWKWFNSVKKKPKIRNWEFMKRLRVKNRIQNCQVQLLGFSKHEEVSHSQKSPTWKEGRPRGDKGPRCSFIIRLNTKMNLYLPIAAWNCHWLGAGISELVLKRTWQFIF